MNLIINRKIMWLKTKMPRRLRLRHLVLACFGLAMSNMSLASSYSHDRYDHDQYTYEMNKEDVLFGAVVGILVIHAIDEHHRRGYRGQSKKHYFIINDHHQIRQRISGECHQRRYGYHKNHVDDEGRRHHRYSKRRWSSHPVQSNHYWRNNAYHLRHGSVHF